MARRFRKVKEEHLIGGTFTVGYESLDDDEFIPVHQAERLVGDTVIVKGAKLVAPCGGTGVCSDGTLYKEQIIDESGKLHITRP